MSVVSSPSSSASTSPFPTTTTSANNDGKASEEKVEEDVLSELEQRVTSVEETILVSSSRSFGEKSDASSVTKSASSKQSLSSTLLFAKLASLRSALVDSRARFIAAKNSGKENEIKRLHDRLEKVLFQIAVVGVLKREDEKNGYQSVPFGRSARAIARDCLLLTF